MLNASIITKNYIQKNIRKPCEKPTVTKRKPPGYWDTPENQRRFLDEMARTLFVVTQGDWHRATYKTTVTLGGYALLDRYHGNIQGALKSIYPELNWRKIVREKMSNNFWESQENQRRFLDELARGEGVERGRDWRRVGFDVVVASGGDHLLSRYRWNVLQTLKSLYPELKWENSVREKVSQNFWGSHENVRLFLDQLATTMGITTRRDWKRIGYKVLTDHSTLARGGSILKVVKSLYPELKWNYFCLNHIPINYWNSENLRDFLSEIARGLNIETWSDWDNVEKKELMEFGRITPLERFGGNIHVLLKSLYPELNPNDLRRVPSVATEKEQISHFFDEESRDSTLRWDELSRDFNNSLKGNRPFLEKITRARHVRTQPSLFFDEESRDSPIRWDELSRDFNHSLIENRPFLDKIACTRHVHTQNDLKEVTKDIVINFGGNSLLCQHGGCVHNTLKSTYPELNWINTQPRDSGGTHHRHLLDRVAVFLPIHTHHDWKEIKYQTLVDLGGGSTLRGKYYLNVLKSLYPELNWSQLSRYRMPNDFWGPKKENLRWYGDKLGCGLFIHIQNDWQKVCTSGVSDLLSRYGVLRILKSVYSELNWDNFHVKINDRKKWEIQEKRRRFLDKIGNESGVHSFKHWRWVNYSTICHEGGTALVRSYPSILAMFVEIYPEIRWDSFSRKRIPIPFWESVENHVQITQTIKDYFTIDNIDDWYRISNHQITCATGRRIDKKKILEMLQTVYPSEKWDFDEFSRRNKKSRQWWLLLKVKEIFPSTLVWEEFRHPNIRRKSGMSLELDVFLPQINLAMEFHGEQHYRDIPSGFSPLEFRKVRDDEKIQLCLEHGIKLIIIPYWWDNQVESLVGTIVQEYPMVISWLKMYVEIGDPIPLNSPIKKMIGKNKIM